MINNNLPPGRTLLLNIKVLENLEHSFYELALRGIKIESLGVVTRVSQKNGPSFFSSKEWPILNFSKIFWREIPQKNGPFIIIHIKQFGKSHFSIWFLINNFDKNSSKEWTKPDFDEIFLKISGPFF